VGVACVAQYTDDGGWYRGQILNVGATEVEVLFVDYGNKQNTPTTLLKAIEWEFVKLPPQAYHCSLAGVQDGSRSWTSQDKTRFEQVGMGKPLTATVSHHRENEKYSVRLVDESSSPHVVINDLFAPPREIVPVPDVFSYSSLPTAELTNVNIAWFCNVGRFFLSPVDLTSYQVNFLFSVVDGSFQLVFLLLKLSLDELEEYYMALSSDELVEDSPSVGLPCVVKFKDDSRFYRSQILSIRGQFASVLFVDYGNEQETALKELKRIHPRFLNFPQLVKFVLPCLI
jgi:tudor domain-containing protein 1/4/6/7